MSNWPHSPIHQLSHPGAYVVTVGTYSKQHFFRDDTRRTFLQDLSLETATKHGWQLQAWAIFSNHYHFVAAKDAAPESLRTMVRELHSRSAIHVNALAGSPGRQVWFEYWDSHLSFQRSYLARLNYVHQNPVRHGLVQRAANYEWCSAGGFENTASPAFVKTVSSFKIDRVNVPDDF